jgi:hypothetical protein
MLAQDKEALRTGLQTKALAIRERELNLYHDSLNAVGTQAALFTGFAFHALVDFEIPEGKSERLVAWFTLSVVFTLVLNLNCVVHAISVCVWGPGLALRGSSHNAMFRAVEGMQQERLRAFQVGFIGTVGIHIATSSMAFIAFDDVLAGTVAVIVAFSIASSAYT